jgi:dihydropyrimidine dehydrogenase (NAD+) subunit PreT
MSDIRPGRLSAEQIAENFGDLHPPLSRREALVEADRCYFCFDAPCTTACPTGIDIPAFIQKIRSDNRLGSAQTILSENIMGGMCARVCPTEVLCEQACVRNTHEDKPIEIGLLQRYATDPVFEGGVSMFSRAPRTGRQVAVVGAGPGGLSCAHRLAMLGHDVVIFDRNTRPGGLNEYGIAAYKTVDDFAQREVEFILSIGGIVLRQGVVLGEDIALRGLMEEFDALFIGIGLGDVNALGIEGESLNGVINAIDYIAGLRQAADKSRLPVGRRIVVIGGGMTAIDVAVQSKRLGAEQVDIVYRRGPAQMGASRFEQELAQTNGVAIRHYGQPVRLLGAKHVEAVEFEKVSLDADGQLSGTGKRYTLDADVVFKAIGQRLDATGLLEAGLVFRHGKIDVDDDQATSVPGIWAGGDCVAGSDDLTVTAVQHGKLAAISIDRYLRSREGKHG